MRLAPVPLAGGLILVALAGLLAAGADTNATAQGVTTVTIGDFFFCDPSLPFGACETVIDVGDTVLWDYSSGVVGHTTTYCGESCDSPIDNPLWDSGFLRPGESFSFTFTTPGTFLYYCSIHPIAMRATIVVQAEATPTRAPVLIPTATPAATAIPESAASASDGGNGDGVSPWWFVVAGIGGALALLGGSALTVRLRQQR